MFRKLYPKPIDDKELSFYAIGEGAHLALQRLADEGGAVSEKEVSLDGIIGTVDIYDGVPIEIKTTRSKDDTPRPFHVKQLSYYMALTGANVGILLYLMINDFEDPFRFRTVTLNDNELAGLRKELKDKAELFKKALQLRDPFAAPHVKHDEELGWKCNRCKYRETCYSRPD